MLEITPSNLICVP